MKKEIRETIVSFPEITVGTQSASLARLFQEFAIDPKGGETLEQQDVQMLWGKTKQDLVEEIDKEQGEILAEVAKLDAIKSELTK